MDLSATAYTLSSRKNSLSSRRLAGALATDLVHLCKDYTLAYQFRLSAGTPLPFYRKERIEALPEVVPQWQKTSHQVSACICIGLDW